MSHISLPEILWHPLRMRYVGAVIILAECAEVVKNALCHHAERITVKIVRRLEAAGRGQ